MLEWESRVPDAPLGILEKWFSDFSVFHHQLENLMEIQRPRYHSSSVALCVFYYLPKWFCPRRKLTTTALQFSATLSKPLIHIIICNDHINFIEWTQTDVVKHSTTDGYLGCFHFFFFRLQQFFFFFFFFFKFIYFWLRWVFVVARGIFFAVASLVVEYGL